MLIQIARILCLYIIPLASLERFFGGFYDGVEKPSLDFIILNEIV